jgi:hypothetical protein
MNVLLFTCAQSAVVDSRTNQLSLFNLLEELNAASFPCTISGLVLILVMLRNPEEPDEAFVTVQSMQEGRVLSGFSLALQFHRHLRTRVVADLNGLTAIGPGVIELSVLSPSQTLMASWKVKVNQALRTTSEDTRVLGGAAHSEVTQPLLLTPSSQKTRGVARTRKKH